MAPALCAVCHTPWRSPRQRYPLKHEGKRTLYWPICRECAKPGPVKARFKPEPVKARFRVWPKGPPCALCATPCPGTMCPNCGVGYIGRKRA